jgi:hypothetical protein
MEFSFPRYLLAKQSVDDRALNKDALATLRAALPPEPLAIIEVGGGVGTMAARLLRWDLVRRAHYTLVDEMPENIAFARTWLPEWAVAYGLDAGEADAGRLRLHDGQREMRLTLREADMFDFIRGAPEPADLLIAHAVLDLLPMPESLPGLFSLSRGLAWLTINFDGLTSFEPIFDAQLEAEIIALYHHSMDTRPGGGDSRSGRHLFAQLAGVGAQILSAGASDWVVHPVDGCYPEEEAYFLDCILGFFESTLNGHPDLDPGAFADWLQRRREQVARGELVYIAHQIDFLVKVP